MPNSFERLAHILSVPTEDLIEESHVKKIYCLQEKLEQVMKQHPDLMRENVWHTLVLLEEAPINRLDRALIRGRKFIAQKN